MSNKCPYCGKGFDLEMLGECKIVARRKAGDKETHLYHSECLRKEDEEERNKKYCE